MLSKDRDCLTRTEAFGSVAFGNTEARRAEPQASWASASLRLPKCACGAFKRPARRAERREKAKLFQRRLGEYNHVNFNNVLLYILVI
jgi:hypothetical protein